MTLRWISTGSPFPEIAIWGTPRLPDGGGYIISRNGGITDGKPWAASFSGGGSGKRVYLGWHEDRARAEAACRHHLKGRRQ